jgi:hypothetical protein
MQTKKEEFQQVLENYYLAEVSKDGTQIAFLPKAPNPPSIINTLCMLISEFYDNQYHQKHKRICFNISIKPNREDRRKVVLILKINKKPISLEFHKWLFLNK